MIRRRSFCVATISLLTCFLTVSPALGAPPEIKGRLDRIGPFRVLRVWGSPREMGFAHGYLLGAEFVAYLNESISALPSAQRPYYDQLRAPLASAIHVSKRMKEELQGIFDGITAAHGSVPKIEGLNRPLRLDDLIWHNAIDALRAFGCSGFTVWGKRAGDAGVITARNFDFPVTGRERQIKGQLILVRHPTGRRRVATIVPPAYIGAFTGFNEDGVCTFMHDGTGKMMRVPQDPFTPVSLVLSEALESCSTADAQTKIHAALQQVVPYPFSYMVRVVTQRVGGSTEKPVHVYRVDADGLSENGVGQFTCVTTNHYLGDDFSPVDGANPWSVTRYKTLEKRIQRVVTGPDAWKALQAVARGSDSGAPTIQAMVVYPEKHRLDLALATWKNKKEFTAAPFVKPTTITFKQLFGTGD